MGNLGSNAVAFVVSAAVLGAQSAGAPAFDVVAIKLNQSGDLESAAFVQPGGRYTATNVTVLMLVKSAYGVHDEQIVGGPEWIDKDRFDISARAEGYDTAAGFRDAARVMLRPLLADRFKLTIRREPRERAVYALMRENAGFGPQFRASDNRECGAGMKALAAAPRAAEPEVPLICGAEVYRPGHLAARAMAISNFVLNLSRYADRVVVDRTGLEGKFDWDLQWIPDEASSPEGPSLTAALREQTGFRLERQRALVEVIVIESVEKPVPDRQ